MARADFDDDVARTLDCGDLLHDRQGLEVLPGDVPPRQRQGPLHYRRDPPEQDAGAFEVGPVAAADGGELLKVLARSALISRTRSRAASRVALWRSACS